MSDENRTVFSTWTVFEKLHGQMHAGTYMTTISSSSGAFGSRGLSTQPAARQWIWWAAALIAVLLPCQSSPRLRQSSWAARGKDEERAEET